MPTVDRWLLPDGIDEVLPREAVRIESARRQLLDLFSRWGYDLVITPHIEYLESLLTGAGHDLELQTFKMIDQMSGRMLGLRADITPQVARIDAHTLGAEGPSRLCYCGSVLHTLPRPLSTSRSLIQLGAELYGDASSASDIEVISLMLETMAVCRVKGVHLDLGHVGIYRGLVQAANLDEATEQALFDALQRKAPDEVAALVGGLPQASIGAMLCSLVELSGGVEVLDRAHALLDGAPESVMAALDDLAEVAQVLTRRYPDVPLYFDLGELRGYHYHTGVVFAAFVPGIGQSVAQGGRYDDIGRDFGRARPATGFSTDLRFLVQRGELPDAGVPASIWAPHSAEADLQDVVAGLRAQGERVIVALPGQGDAEAAQHGCSRRLAYSGGGWQVVELNS
ncbi:ATP phosphoribosyltransferase regulatory subunit [Halopseudomonas aestusnigri]|mgnify:FL=1|jgi:ATP phosphoribosyltransferase regulatory subunit|uniref:ATP phosphoribosyltransferase regulatory subunit n=1 Tax=Halopseudomonas aestusnigri TaxID=857252 RepID=UPI000C381FFC|nr:ATP phosphoribosyltransferase regulatory subunit [Halopseudomonas aestusnigri]MAD27231.1 ATP phosphoribosyltransferase regulatory subunit [Pseudomonadales bacterium]HBT58187.1 ATP phosphoribosyltransferase regulatory subunit [Pseudomonas sp.]MAY08150.1 ATP phosphoribosyltransferase regulatory subunit [Pseudomonadales bacterium]MCC4259515.1 ATP phosphoribosyltransferase regulatory subunit [Halopseudomonas aestusnigri]MDL2197910.1 ATP phosphoribosyltransferase regulatory subunit [Halopseudomo|tara:strand:- start:1584 stop:2774 length:1191 start_codon:yes stop_codon:yes gene_type:complete